MNQSHELSKILSGFSLAIGLHFLVFLIGGLCATVASAMGVYSIGSVLVFALFGIGIVQLIYIIPTIIWLSRKREWGLMKGVIIAAVITALLNGGCWLWVYSMFPPR